MTNPQPMTVLCSEDGCREEAIYSYVWPWGTPGTCCAQHSITLNQRATQQLDIPGGLRLVTIDPGRQPVITRDERAQLRAGVMVRDDEINELKVQVANLTKSAGDLSAQVQRYRGNARHLEDDAAELRLKLDQVITERDAALADQADLKAEIARLQLIINAAAIPGATPAPIAPNP